MLHVPNFWSYGLLVCSFNAILTVDATQSQCMFINRFSCAHISMYIQMKKKSFQHRYAVLKRLFISRKKGGKNL